MIKVKNLVYRYDKNEKPVLNNIDLEVLNGEYVGIIGPNGSGKTTLIKHFNALLFPTAGDVWVDEMSTRDTAAVRKIRQKVGMVFQNPDNQIVGMTVEEDVSFGPGNLRLPPSEIRKRVEESLGIVGLGEHAKKPPHTLSSGEKQLLAIAGVLAMNPECIVLDEPTAHLDPAGRKRVLDVIKRLHRERLTVIHVTHNMDEIVETDQIIVMNGGRILLKEKPAEVFNKCEWLKGLSLDIPKIVELMWRLRQLGNDVRPDVLTLEDAYLEISALIKRIENAASC